MTATDLLAGRTVLVTGAGNGVGRGIALTAAAWGANVAVTSLADNGRETTDLVRGRGGTAEWFRCDVSSRADVEAAVAGAVERFGALHALVHNATSRRSSEVLRLEDATADVLDDHVGVSLRGAFHCAVTGFPHLRATGGRLLLFTSPAGMEGSAASPLYGAVKAGLRAFTKSLAKEWGPAGVNVNCLSVLAVTPALANAYRERPELEDRLRRIVPLGRVGDPETDIGPVVAFLASDESRYVTGQTIVVDGGRFTGL